MVLTIQQKIYACEYAIKFLREKADDEKSISFALLKWVADVAKIDTSSFSALSIVELSVYLFPELREFMPDDHFDAEVNLFHWQYTLATEKKIDILHELLKDYNSLK